jgi:hypothetical protein
MNYDYQIGEEGTHRIHQYAGIVPSGKQQRTINVRPEKCEGKLVLHMLTFICGSIFRMWRIYQHDAKGLMDTELRSIGSCTNVQLVFPSKC